MGYRFSMMPHFQNGLISEVFRVFSIRFYDRTTVNDL